MPEWGAAVRLAVRIAWTSCLWVRFVLAVLFGFGLLGMCTVVALVVDPLCGCLSVHHLHLPVPSSERFSLARSHQIHPP